MSSDEQLRKYGVEGRRMIAKIDKFLQEEYKFMNENTHDFCNLKPLACVKKRICTALNIGPHLLTKSLKEQKKLDKYSSRSIICNECREIITRLFHFLREEYKYMKDNNHESCDLSRLANIRKRTANATGVSEVTVAILILGLEKQLEKPKQTVNNEEAMNNDVKPNNSKTMRDSI